LPYKEAVANLEEELEDVAGDLEEVVGDQEEVVAVAEGQEPSEMLLPTVCSAALKQVRARETELN
jgi:hypothetical protein